MSFASCAGSYKRADRLRLFVIALTAIEQVGLERADEHAGQEHRQRQQCRPVHCDKKNGWGSKRTRKTTGGAKRRRRMVPWSETPGQTVLDMRSRGAFTGVHCNVTTRPGCPKTILERASRVTIQHPAIINPGACSLILHAIGIVVRLMRPVEILKFHTGVAEKASLRAKFSSGRSLVGSTPPFVGLTPPSFPDGKLQQAICTRHQRPTTSGGDGRTGLAGSLAHVHPGISRRIRKYNNNEKKRETSPPDAQSRGSTSPPPTRTHLQ